MPNLQSILIFNRNFSLNNKHLCNNVNETVCKFHFKNNFLFCNKFYFPLINNNNCNNTHLVYIIICKLCKIFYIGETSKRAVDRIKQHIYSIKSFKPFENVTSEVSEHFNLRNHKLDIHFEFCIFKDNLIDKESRLSIESDLIHLFKMFNFEIINKKISNHNYIKSLSFS
jgi:hypothetical protein